MKLTATLSKTCWDTYMIVLNYWSLETGNLWEFYKEPFFTNEGIWIESIREYGSPEMAIQVIETLDKNDFKAGYPKKYGTYKRTI